MPHSVSHRLHVDRARKLIDLRIKGLIAPEDAAWIGEELRAGILSLGEAVGQHATLYDVREVPVVPPATVDLLKRTFDSPQVRALWARKVAFVVGTTLARLQVQRLREVRPDMGIFEDREEAIGWLLAE